MKKTELVQFKEEYESAVRNVDEIINNPYTAILLKYKKAAAGSPSFMRHDVCNWRQGAISLPPFFLEVILWLRKIHS